MSMKHPCVPCCNMDSFWLQERSISPCIRCSSIEKYNNERKEKMSYYYSESDVEDMYRAGILQRPGDTTHTQQQVDLIENNTKCPKCNGAIKVIKWNTENGIKCTVCGYLFD